MRVIGIWKLDPATPIPRDTGEIGRPLIYYKQDMAAAPVQVEDISATGMALRLEQGKSEISWFHSTPARGVSPITQWVMGIDREQKKLL